MAICDYWRSCFIERVSVAYKLITLASTSKKVLRTNSQLASKVKWLWLYLLSCFNTFVLCFDRQWFGQVMNEGLQNAFGTAPGNRSYVLVAKAIVFFAFLYRLGSILKQGR